MGCRASRRRVGGRGASVVVIVAFLHALRSITASSMASAYGAQSPAPGTSVDSAPAAHARRSASSWPSSHPAASTPAKTSPAPVVSTGSTAVRARRTARRRRDSWRRAAAGDHQMRYRPVPFARLGLVDHDDVGQFGQREQVVRFRAGGRRVDDDDRARVACDSSRGDSGGDRDLQLHQHDVAVGDHGADIGGRPRSDARSRPARPRWCSPPRRRR